MINQRERFIDKVEKVRPDTQCPVCGTTSPRCYGQIHGNLLWKCHNCGEYWETEAT